MNDGEKKVLLVTFSDNADHQDITFGMFEQLYPEYDVWLMCIKKPRVGLNTNNHVRFVDCPERPGIVRKTFKLHTLNREILWIWRQKFDVIFFETLHTWNLPIMLFCHRKSRIYQMIHDVVPHTGDKQAKSIDLMNRVVCKLADYIVLVNQKYLARVSQLYGISSERVRHVDMWRRFPEYTVPRHTGKVLFFGRLNPYKGVDNLLEIVTQCPDIRFSVIGRMDPSVESLVRQLEKRQNVEVNTGYVTDSEMKEAFVEADWVILPYNSATQSGVVIDAYRYARPVIAFNVGALSEQIEDGVSGYLLPKKSNELFARKLKQLVALKREQYDTLSRNAYEFGVNKYSSQRAAKRFLSLIQERVI